MPPRVPPGARGRTGGPGAWTRHFHGFRQRLDGDIGAVIRGSSFVIVGKGIGAAVAFAFTVILGQRLGADGSGAYFLAAGVVTIAAILGRVGLDHGVLRFTAERAAGVDRAGVHGVHRAAMPIALAGSLAATSLVVALAPTLAGVVFGNPSLTLPMRLMALGIVPLSLGEMYAQLLYGAGRHRDAVILQAVLRPILLVAILAMVADEWGVTGAVAAFVLGNVGVLLLSVVAWRRAEGGAPAEPEPLDRGMLLRTCLPLFAVAALGVIMATTDVIMIGIWRSNAEVGAYAVAARTAGIASMALVAVNSIVGPRFAGWWHTGARARVAGITRATTALMACLAALYLTTAFIFAAPLLGLFGPGFLMAQAAFLILAGGEAVALATGPMSHLLVMTGHERLHRNVVFGAAALNVALNAWLIPVAGIAGAAVATSLALTAKNVLYVIIVHRSLGIRLVGTSATTTGAPRPVDDRT